MQKSEIEKELEPVIKYFKEKMHLDTIVLYPELPLNIDPEGIPKENAWIVWLCDDDQMITDLQVYELDANLPYRWEKIVGYVEEKMKGIHFRDCGRVNSDWNEWDLADILFKFGCQYGFKDRKIMVKCLERLATIKEFKEDIDGWLNFLK